MISSEWKVDKVDYVKVRLKWWHLRKTNVANITMTSNVGNLYIPNNLPDKNRENIEGLSAYIKMLEEAMNEEAVYPLVNSWHTPPMSASERDAVFKAGFLEVIGSAPSV